MLDYSDKKINRENIRDIFVNACKAEQKIGIEVEKIGIRADKILPPTYRGKEGYLAILGRLYEELGWKIVKQEGRFILRLDRCGAKLDLESDGRIELAGSAHESLHDLVREFRIHQNEIAEISNIYGIIWLGTGYHPFSKNKELEEVPDERKIMIVDYMEEVKNRTGNDFGLAWMKKTAGIHVNMDYSSEADFSRKTKILTKLTPVLSAIFANSPFSNGKLTGKIGFRSHVANNTTLRQFEFDADLYHSDFGFDAWIDHVLSMPLLFLHKDEKWMNGNLSFGEYLDNGIDGYFATMEDFDLHVKSVWKDIKVKSVIELRCIDSLPPFLVPSVPALLKGLIYDEDALKFLEEETDKWTYQEFLELRQCAANNGLMADFRGKKLLGMARDLIDLAESSLKKNRVNNYFGEDESIYLNPIKEFVFGYGSSPSEWLIHQWAGKWRKNFYPVIEWWQY